MHVNRLKDYFNEVETSNEAPLTAAVAFEILVQAPDRDFTNRLTRVMTALRKDAKTHKAPATELLGLILCPCFIQTGSPQSLFQIEFIGDECRARRVLCAASVLFLITWEQLTPDARKWARDLLICAIPNNLNLEGLRALANAKTLIGSLMSGMTYPKSHATSAAEPYQGSSGMVDPFIGL